MGWWETFAVRKMVEFVRVEPAPDLHVGQSIWGAMIGGEQSMPGWRLSMMTPCRAVDAHWHSSGFTMRAMRNMPENVGGM